MSTLFLIATYLRRNDIVDSTWGPSFVVGSWAFYQNNPTSFQNNPRAALALLFLLAWALRLALHIGFRNFQKGHSEDVRYANFRRAWGKHWVIRSFLQIFMLQGSLMLIIAMPLIWIFTSPAMPLGTINALGAGLWAFGFGFETIADWQLRNFKNENKKNGLRGKILQSGLWKYSRHPNYFGEVVLWWGFYFLALGLNHSWITTVSPVMITFLILKVSGIPMLEREFEKRSGWLEYKNRTSAFFPRRPKSESTLS